MKFATTKITFSENPLESASFTIAISGCPGRCPGCHSPHLRCDIGNQLTLGWLKETMDNMPYYVTCITFLGGDWSIQMPSLLVWLRKNYPQYKYCLYSGKEDISTALKRRLDYYKVGPYIERLGGLDRPETNQKFYVKERHGTWVCKNWVFWKDLGWKPEEGE